MRMTLTTKTPTEKSKKVDFKKLHNGEKTVSKSPAKKVYPTGVICRNEGCEKIGLGDEYCSTVCAKEDNGVAVTTFSESFAIQTSRLGKAGKGHWQ